MSFFDRLAEALARMGRSPNSTPEQLQEAGRVLSRKNESRIRTAKDELGAVLDELGIEVEESLTEAERSLNQTQSVLADAVRVAFAKGPRTYAYLADVYPGYLVYCLTTYVDGDYNSVRTLYQVEYAVSASDQVTFGEPFAVVARTVYEPVADEAMAEAGVVEGDTIPLIERAIREDGTGEIKVIAPGWGSSGYYPAEVLRRDGGKAFPAGTHMHIDHPTDREARERPERSVESLAAVTTADAVWKERGPEGPGLYAPIRVKPSHRQDLDDIAKEIGTSIYASGTFAMGEAEGKKGRIVQSLAENPSNTIDFVTRAGAGGKVLTLLESRRTPAPVSDTITITENQEDPMADEATNQELAALREAVKKLTENAHLTKAKEVVEGALRPYARKLHARTIARLQESLVREAVITDAGVDVAATEKLVEAAANGALAELAEILGEGRISGMGASFAESQTPIKDEDIEADLAESFQDLGLSESGAKIAAKGRLR